MTEDIIVELLQERLQSPDCNAGVIFENMTSSTLFNDEKIGIRAILRAVPDQHVQLINLHYPTDEAGLPVSEIIDPNRVAGIKPIEEKILNAQLSQPS
mmetsp:Transcript_39419/g.35154  ORF Transcript_39419/g.35154 Transcript_39419/m.35154 type:complete len:98 (+) Transcript_39419:341-634(+)